MGIKIEDDVTLVKGAGVWRDGRQNSGIDLVKEVFDPKCEHRP